MTQNLVLAFVLFAIGAWGAMARRNLIIVLLSIEVMLNAVNLAFVTFSHDQLEAGSSNAGAGHLSALFVLALAAAETAVGLSIVVVFFRNRGTVDTRDMAELKE